MSKPVTLEDIYKQNDRIIKQNDMLIKLLGTKPSKEAVKAQIQEQLVNRHNKKYAQS